MLNLIHLIEPVDQIVQLEREIINLEEQSKKTGLSEVETLQIQADIQDKRTKAQALSKQLAEETANAEKKNTEELQKQADLRDKINQLTRKQRDAQQGIGEKKAAITDPTKLTVAELANLPNEDQQKAVQAAQDERRRRQAFTFGYGANLSSDQKAAAEKAQQVQQLEAEAEAARLAGNSELAGQRLKEAGAQREQLVASGFVKSTEGDPMKEQVKELQKANEELMDITKELQKANTALAGKFVNQ